MIPLRVAAGRHATAWVWPGSSPAVSLRIEWTGGAALDPPGRSGAGALAAALLNEGAGPLGAEQFADALRDRGIGLSFGVDRDRFGLALRCLREDWAEAVRLAGLALAAPLLEPTAVARTRARLLLAARRNDETPRGRAGEALWAALLPGHPAARPPQGDPAGLAAVTEAELRPVLAALQSGPAVAAAAGDLPEAEVAAALDILVPGAPAGARLPSLPPAPAAFTTVVPMEAPQAQVNFGHVAGMGPADPAWEAGQVAMRILAGGGFGPRLSEVVRERGGLTYGIGAFPVPLADGAVIVGGAATRNDGVAQTIALVRQEWVRMAAEGPTEEELADAVGFLIGTQARQFTETPRAAAALIAARRTGRSPEWLQRRPERLRALTLPQVAAAAARLLDSDRLSFLVAGRPVGL
jgi:zinc protease